MILPDIFQVLVDTVHTQGFWGAVLAILAIVIYKIVTKIIDIIGGKFERNELHLSKLLGHQNRKLAVFKINRLLRELMEKIGADRIAVFEYHNGGCNVTGMPFLHFSISTQLNKLGVDELSKDFDDVLVSSVPEFIQTLENEAVYMAETVDIKTTFPRLYRELEEDKMKDLIIASIEGLEETVGFILVAYNHPIPVTKKKLLKEIAKKLLKLAIYLDGNPKNKRP